jgi:hypothetical protein
MIFPTFVVGEARPRRGSTSYDEINGLLKADDVALITAYEYHRTDKLDTDSY